MNWNSETHHMMIDLETLGMTESAIIISAAAVVFTSEDIIEEYYAEFDWNQKFSSLTPDTVKFWMEQAAEGKRYPCGVEQIETLTSSLNRLYKDNRCEAIWANGTDFDIPMLKYQYALQSFNVPWKYNAVRDCRTVFKLFERSVNLDHLFCGEKHNALADCKYQVEKLQCVLNTLNDSDMV